MNRQQRRQAAKAARRGQSGPYGAHDLDCGCQQRFLVPLEAALCPACGAVSPALSSSGTPFPTSAPVGAIITLEVGCACGMEFPVLCTVD